MRKTSKLILGTVQFGLDYGINNPNGKLLESEAHHVLKLAKSGGVEYLDTAAGYGNSETIIGSFLNLDSGSFNVITKLSTSGEISLEDSLKRSLERLRVPSVDTILFHSFKHYMESLEHIDVVKALIDQNKVQRIGVSVYTNDELIQLIDDKNVSVIQAPFNLLDNHNLRGEIFKKLKENGKEIHTRSVFLQGLFFKNEQDFPRHLLPLKEPVEFLKSLCAKHKVSMAALALSYAMSKNYIDKILFGVDNVDQLKTNFKMLEIDIPNEIFKEIDSSILVTDTRLLNPANWKL